MNKLTTAERASERERENEGVEGKKEKVTKANRARGRERGGGKVSAKGQRQEESVKRVEIDQTFH